MKTSAEQLFNEISAFVDESQRLLKEDQLLELDGLDKNVRDLCEMVLKLSQAERVAHAEKLQRLLRDLSALGEALVARRDALGEELMNTTQHHKANIAYRKSDHIDRKKEE